MVDIEAAGARLRSVRIEENPPLAEIEGRRRRRTRFRRARTTGVATAMIIGIALAATAVIPRSGHRTQRVTVGQDRGGSPGPSGIVPSGRLRAVPHAPGAIPVDRGRLRLWLPPGWTETTPSGDCWSGDRTVIFSDQAPSDCGGGTGLWVAPLGGRLMPDRSVLNGLTVRSNVVETVPGAPIVYDVPALDVAIYARHVDKRVLDSLGPSSLDAVLDQRYPTRVPAGWRKVTFDGFVADVPRSWPTRILASTNAPGLPTFEPGTCGSKDFSEPTTYVGFDPHDPPPSCPASEQGANLEGRDGPGNGLWLKDVVRGDPASVRGDSVLVQGPIAAHLGGEEGGDGGLVGSYVPNAGSDTIDIERTVAGRTLEATVGLGTDPSVAEGIISSLRPVRST